MSDRNQTWYRRWVRDWTARLKPLAPDFFMVGPRERIVARGDRSVFAECRRKYRKLFSAYYRLRLNNIENANNGHCGLEHRSIPMWTYLPYLVGFCWWG